jgi:hypothetical protein
MLQVLERLWNRQDAEKQQCQSFFAQEEAIAGNFEALQPNVMRNSIPSFGTKSVIPGDELQCERCHEGLQGLRRVVIRAEPALV